MTVQQWLDDTLKALITSYETEGRKASGNWANQLEGVNERKGDSIIVTILGEKYTGAFETGRKPNTDQSPEAIKRWVGWAGNTIIADWVSDKGLSINPFAVAYKLATKGVEIPNRFNTGDMVGRTINDSRIKELIKAVGFAQSVELTSDVIRRLKR